MSLTTLYHGQGSEQSSPKNTGSNKEKLYKATIRYALARESFFVETYNKAILKDTLDQAIVSKDVVPFFSVEGSELANVEATYYDSRTVKYQTAPGRKGLKVKHHLGVFSHAALKSYENSEYTRIIEFTEDNKILMVNSNGVLKGQKLSNFIVGMKEEPVIAGAPPTTSVDIIYEDYKEFETAAQVISPNYRTEDLQGIFDVHFEPVSISDTEVTFKAYLNTGEEVKNITINKLKFLKLNGEEQTVTAKSFNGEVYVFTGTGFTSGHIVTDGVDYQTKIKYEGVNKFVEIVTL